MGYSFYGKGFSLLSFCALGTFLKINWGFVSWFYFQQHSPLFSLVISMGSVDFFNVIFFPPLSLFLFSLSLFFGVSLYSFDPYYYICEGHVGRGLIYAYIHRDENSSSST